MPDDVDLQMQTLKPRTNAGGRTSLISKQTWIESVKFRISVLLMSKKRVVCKYSYVIEFTLSKRSDKHRGRVSSLEANEWKYDSHGGRVGGRRSGGRISHFRHAVHCRTCCNLCPVIGRWHLWSEFVCVGKPEVLLIHRTRSTRDSLGVVRSMTMRVDNAFW